MKNKKEKISIVLSRREKIKRLKRWSRETVGRPRPGKVILPKKGGPYRRRVKHRKPLSEDD